MKIAIGFISYNQSSFKYLPFFLPSLKKALDNLDIDYRLLALDNSDNFNANKTYIEDFFKKNNLTEKSNIFSLGFNSGFARGFNFLIRKAIDFDCDLFMAINPDVVLDENSIFELVRAFKSKSKEERVSSVGPKILNWDFVNDKKTDIIDSLGIGMSFSHHFFDIRQGEEDNTNFYKENVFGISGAAVIYNLEALKEVAFDNGNSLEFFDELMFMYKEDVDLAYRLNLANWNSFLVPDSLIYHDRSLSTQSYNFLSLIFGKKTSFRSWSYLNQMIIFLKFRKINFSFKIKFFSFLRLFLIFFYGLFFNFSQIKKLIYLFPEVEKRRKNLKIKENCVNKIESLIKNT
ncbi:MAG: glycosyltransferase family 2 protein [Patescibacteria group bacterium]